MTYQQVHPTDQDARRDIPAAVYFPLIAGIEPGEGNTHCPNPAHKDTTLSCRLAGHVWYCHGCHAGGNIDDLASVVNAGPTLFALRADEKALGSARRLVQERCHHLLPDEPDEETFLCSERELEEAGFSIGDLDEMPDVDHEFVAAPDSAPDEDSGDPLERLAANPVGSSDSLLSRTSMALAEFMERWPIDRFEPMLELAAMLDLNGSGRPCKPRTVLS